MIKQKICFQCKQTIFAEYEFCPHCGYCFISTTKEIFEKAFAKKQNLLQTADFKDNHSNAKVIKRIVFFIIFTVISIIANFLILILLFFFGMITTFVLGFNVFLIFFFNGFAFFLLSALSGFLVGLASELLEKYRIDILNAKRVILLAFIYMIFYSAATTLIVVLWGWYAWEQLLLISGVVFSSLNIISFAWLTYILRLKKKARLTQDHVEKN